MYHYGRSFVNGGADQRNKPLYEDGDLTIRLRGGVCELFRMSLFGEWLDRAENVYLISIEVF